MNANDAGIRLSIGISGSGKTHGVKQDVYRAASGGMPVIVLDRMHEWDRGDAGARTPEEAATAVERGARLVILRPRSGELLPVAEALCSWARDHRELAGVAIPEAHRVAPNAFRTLPPALEDVALTWRHYRVALWLDTQRLPLLNRTLTEQAGTIRIYAVTGELDRRMLRELGGRELERANVEVCSHLARGEPGWHVALGVMRAPPYTVVRETSSRVETKAVRRGK